MSDLRNKLIRLAHKNPELREHLIPIIKTAGKWSDWDSKGFVNLQKGVLGSLSEADIPTFVTLVAKAIRDDWHWSKFEVSLRASKLSRQAQKIILTDLNRIAYSYQ